MGLNLKEPIGPLPLGAWVAVVAGGLGISWYSRRHASAPAAVAAAPVTDGAGTFTDAGTGNVSGGASSTAPPPSTNDEWGRLAVFTLLGHGFDPLTADRAIRDYLAGNNLDASEKADIDAALRFIGPPPIPVPPPIPAPPGGDTTTPPPIQVVPPVVPTTIQSGSGFFTGPQSQLDDILRNNRPPSGAYPVTVKGDDGATYEWLSPTAEANVIKTGELVYVQEAPGHFVAIGPWAATVGLLAGTPIYLRVGSGGSAFQSTPHIVDAPAGRVWPHA